MEQSKEKGNVILFKEEILILQQAILNKYTILTNKTINRKKLNSNLNNYTELYDSIDALVSLKQRGIRSKKPLSVIFHLNNDNKDESKSFRKKFIEALYQYAYRLSRHEVIQKVQSQAPDPYINIAGYWELYYDKIGDFKSRILKTGKSELAIIAIFIQPHGITVKYHHATDNGVGKVGIYGSNFSLQLRSNITGDIGFLILNIGQKDIVEYGEHVKFAGGVFNHANKSGYPKIGRCAMVHYPEKGEADITNHEKNCEITIDDLDTKQKLRNFFCKSYNVGHVSSHGISGATNITGSAADFLH